MEGAVEAGERAAREVRQEAEWLALPLESTDIVVI